MVALADELGVLAAGDAGVLAGDEDVVLRGELGDAAGGAVLEAGGVPGGDGAGAALGGLDVAVTGLAGATLLGGLHDVEGEGEGLDGGEVFCRGVAFEIGVLLLGEVGEALAEALGSFGLGDGFAAVELLAAGVGPGVGAEEEAAAGSEGGGCAGGEFAAVAAVGLAGVVGLLFEVAELEVALVFGGGEFDAGLAGAVVEDELVEPAQAVAAVAELLALDAGEAGVVGVGCGLFAGEEGGGVGAGLHGAAADPVALGVAAALAVIGGADDDGTIDVAILEGDDDFLAGARGEVAAPVAAGDGGHDAQPDAEGVAGRGVVRAGGVGVATSGLGAALPGELDADATVAVSVGGTAGADDDAGEAAPGSGAGVDVAAVGIGHRWAPGGVGTDGGDLVAVEIGPLRRAVR